MGCGPSTARVSVDPPQPGEQPLDVIRRTSTLGELRSSVLGTNDAENLRILENAEQEGSLRGARGRGSPSDMPAQVMLLGASGVGKTTLLRSMVHAFEGERNAQSAEAAALGAHLFHLLRELLKVMTKLSISFDDKNLQQRAWQMTKLQMLDTHVEQVRFVTDLSAVLEDPQVASILSRDEVLPPHTSWFFSQHDRILSETYTPLLQDLLRMRVRTTGVGRSQLRKLERPFEALDVGGMRAERRKWGSVMRSVDTVIMVAALSDWDDTLAEDKETNRLVESITLYKSTVTELSELGISVCLFLTKDDELRRQLASDAPRCLETLASVLGTPVGCEPGGDGPIDDPRTLSSEQLHACVVGSIQRRFEACARCAMSVVLDATNPDAARNALDSAIMHTLTTYARSGRGQTSCTPSSNESGSVFESQKSGGRISSMLRYGS